MAIVLTEILNFFKHHPESSVCKAITMCIHSILNMYDVSNLNTHQCMNKKIDQFSDEINDQQIEAARETASEHIDCAETMFGLHTDHKQLQFGRYYAVRKRIRFQRGGRL